MLDARELRQGAKGNVFVSTLFVANKVYVIPEKGERKPKLIIDKTPYATGIESCKGALYFATNTRIVRYDSVEDRLDNLGEPKVLYDKLPGGDDHSWRFLRVHKDKLYFAIGAPCNICDPGDYASLKGYKTGKRVGYTPAMNEALSQVPVEDLDLLAYYVARVPPASRK